jgi:hypothetical protein
MDHVTGLILNTIAVACPGPPTSLPGNGQPQERYAYHLGEMPSRGWATLAAPTAFIAHFVVSFRGNIKREPGLSVITFHITICP